MTTARFSSSVRVLAVAVLVCLVLGTSLVVAEALTRYRERRMEQPGSLSLAFYKHRRLGTALVRDSDYFGWFHVDEHGFRGGPVESAKPSGVLRIMAVGGSTTFDASVVGDDHAWPARLGHWLGVFAPDAAVEVINAGVPGYRLLDNLIRLQTELYVFDPDIIVLYQAHNDLASSLWYGTRVRRATRRPDEVEPATPWGQWLATNSLLYHKLRAKANQLIRSVRSRGADPQAADTTTLRRAVLAGEQQFGRDLASFLAIARELGICVVLPEAQQISGVGTRREEDAAILRAWGRTFAGTPPETVLDGYDRFRAVLHTVGGRGGAAVISTEHYGLRGTQYFAADDAVHFSAAGADRMGRSLAASFRDFDLLDVSKWCPHRVTETPLGRGTESETGASPELAMGGGRAVASGSPTTMQ